MANNNTLTGKSVKKTKLNIPSVEEDIGRIPPQALDLEESILGAIMLEKDAINEVADILKPEVFYKEAHQIIYKAIEVLFAQLAPIDTLTVVEELRKSGEIDLVGGPAYVAQLTRKVLSAANIKYHAHIVLQKYVLRELIRTSSEIIRKAYDETTDVFDLLNEAEDNLFRISEQNFKQSVKTLPSLLLNIREQINAATKTGNQLVGVPSGFIDLDRITMGWQKSDLIIIAARPAMGKTAFVLSLARNLILLHKRPVAFFSLEMSAAQIATRLLCAESFVSSDKLRSGKLTPEELTRINIAMEKLAEAPIYIDDTPGITLFELRTKCRKFKQKNKIELVIIDYLQLMVGDTATSRSGTREQEISSISRGLKGLAKELDIPIICLSQLSRNVEKRAQGHNKPQLSDLRESGSIEQDADIVIFLYRPEYYGLESPKGPGATEIIIAKHRNGPTDTIHLKFIPEVALFENLDAEITLKDVDDIKPNNKFYSNEPKSYIVESKLNSMNDDDYDNDYDDEEAPF